MKKVLWALGAIVALIVVLVVAAGVIVYMTVTKDFVASKMSAALNRHVTIESIDVSLFSVISGIEVKKRSRRSPESLFLQTIFLPGLRRFASN